MNKGRLYIISGPSGCGKDTILAGLFKIFPDLLFSISSITRDKREGEVEGEKYNFIALDKFESMIENDQLLEYNLYIGNYYGTPKEPVIKAIESGKDMVIEVDVNGAANIRKSMPEAVSVFILPPSLKELEKRLIERGTETPEKIAERLSCARREISRATEYDYILINDNIDEAIECFADILRTDKLKADRNFDLVNKILDI